MYRKWEIELSKKPQKVIFASRILERFSTTNWNDSTTKQRITIELKNYIEKFGQSKNKKTSLTRLATMINMNSDLGSAGNNTFNAPSGGLPNAKILIQQDPDIDEEQAELIENFIKEQKKQATLAPKYEFIMPVKEFIAQIIEVHKKLKPPPPKEEEKKNQ